MRLQLAEIGVGLAHPDGVYGNRYGLGLFPQLPRPDLGPPPLGVRRVGVDPPQPGRLDPPARGVIEAALTGVEEDVLEFLDSGIGPDFRLEAGQRAVQPLCRVTEELDLRAAKGP